MPSEGKGVIDVASTGPSLRKAYYSDYGNGYIDVSAPGGDAYDTPGNTRDITKAILAAYPKQLAEENGQLNPDGTPWFSAAELEARFGRELQPDGRYAVTSYLDHHAEKLVSR